jgi:hypothetical protein
MKTLMRASLLLMIAATVVLGSCGDKKSESKKSKAEKRAQMTVDCDRMCTKTFRLCVSEVLVGSGKLDQAKIDMIKKAGAFKKVQDAGYGACVKDCKKKEGFGTDAADINVCLKMDKCADYAKCIKQHIR